MTREEAKYLMKLPLWCRKVKLNDKFKYNCKECSYFRKCFIEKELVSHMYCSYFVTRFDMIGILSDVGVRGCTLLYSGDYGVRMYSLLEEVTPLINILTPSSNG